jgi:hypothetical protein
VWNLLLERSKLRLDRSEQESKLRLDRSEQESKLRLESLRLLGRGLSICKGDIFKVTEQ